MLRQEPQRVEELVVADFGPDDAVEGGRHGR
jgi:hypothetical protein